VQHDPENCCLHSILTASARDLPLDRIDLSAGSTISLYADNVSGARSMALVPGTLYVTEVNYEKTWSVSYYPLPF